MPRAAAAALLAFAALAAPAGCAGGPAPRSPEASRAGEERPRARRPADPSGGRVRITGEGAIRAGAASRVITPVLSAGAPRMAGFAQGKDATGIHDDLYARALVLEAGEASIALVALDLIGFFHDDVVLIRQEIRARHPDVGVGYVMVSSTHTHAGPDVIGLWTPAGGALDPAYVARVRSEAADAVAEAWSRRRRARLSFASVRLPEMVRDTRLPEVVDPLAILMKVDAADGRETIASLINFASHPEVLGRANTLLSSDYPGAARRVLEDQFGGIALFASGAIGGLLTPLGAGLYDPSSATAVPEKTFLMVQAYGERLARALMSAWRERSRDGPSAVARVSLDVRADVVRVPLDNPRFVRGLAEGRIHPRALSADGTLTSEAAVVTLRASAAGEPLARLACVPGEIYPELVLGGVQSPQDPGGDLQGAAVERPLGALLAARHRLILGLCNDELGYIIPTSEWDSEPPFAYGRDSPQYGEMNSVGPRVAPTLLRAFEELLGHS